MKSLVEITASILFDCGMQCGANPVRDLITITRRVEHEGDSFLTITLPAFCSDFERSLAEGAISPALTCSFKRARGTCLPRFLGGFMEMVFDSKGRVLETPSVDAIRCIRQICLLHKKVLRPCSQVRQDASMKKYVSNELRLRDVNHNSSLHDVFRRVSRIVWASIMEGIPFGDPYLQYIPAHGRGSTADMVKGNRKFRFTSWPRRLESEFPFLEFGIASLRNPDSLDRNASIHVVEPRDEIPMKVTLVPKTLKTPRIIASEPTAMQWIQQAIARWLIDRVELRSKLTSGHINFRDQTVNGNLARQSSVDGRFSTIDLSDASDLVSSKLVWTMLETVPAFRRQVFSCRSTRVKLPNGRILPIRKFAPMGSALCFPIESVAFFCAAVSVELYRAGRRPNPRNIFDVSRSIYVYGDDIVVPTDMAPAVAVHFETFGFKVNAAKSFWTGKFRESCGTECYDGVDVKPVYLRRDIPQHRADVHGVVSSVAFANQLYEAGYWRTSRLVRNEIEKILGPLPSVTRDSQAIGWHSYSNAMSFNGWSSSLQRLNLRCFVATPIRVDDPLDGDPALLKCFGTIGLSDVHTEHLRTSVRYGNLALKRRWI